MSECGVGEGGEEKNLKVSAEKAGMERTGKVDPQESDLKSPSTN